MTFKSKYNIKGDVDFVDIDLEHDNKLFVDPYLIYLEKDAFSINCSNKIVNYFGQLLECARNNDISAGHKLVSYLQENNEIRFGYSSEKPNGKGLGYNKGKELFNLLCKSKAINTGLVQDIFDASIMLENVGYDKISDLTINIILEDLILFTQNVCKKNNIKTNAVTLKRPIWCSKTNSWIEMKDILLPVHKNKPIILVPKAYVREYLVYTYSRFYSHHMIPYYEHEVMNNPSCGLVKILKRGIVPSRTKIRKSYPCIKENVIDFISNNPNEYHTYKKNQLKYIDKNKV